MTTDFSGRRTISRLSKVYGPNGRIPIGRSGFYKHFIKTGKLKLVPLGERAVGLVDDEVDIVVNELIAARDTTPPKTKRQAVGAAPAPSTPTPTPTSTPAPNELSKKREQRQRDHEPT